MQMSIDLRFVNDIGGGDKGINVVVCIRRNTCSIPCSSSGVCDEGIVYFNEEIDLVVVGNK